MMPGPSRPRLLQLITLSDWGGAQACVLALARGLRDAFEVTVGCAPGGPMVARLRAEGIDVVEIPSMRRTLSPLADLVTLRRLTARMRRERFSIVHCHSTKAGLLGRVAARLAGVPCVVFTAHGWPFTEGYHPAMKTVIALTERVVARVTTAIICVAEHVRHEALRMRIGRPDQLHVIHNGIDPSAYLRVLPQASGTAGDVRTAITVSRLQDPKDPATLIAAWARVQGHHRLDVVGDGPQRPALESLIATLGLGDRVALRGARDDIPARLGAADVFVLASRWEGLPLVIIEAMMNGLPVVASNVGGVPELVIDGETGILVPPRDVGALARALDLLLGDAALRRTMAAAGQRRAREHFAEAQMLARTVDLYGRMLRRRGMPVGRA